MDTREHCMCSVALDDHIHYTLYLTPIMNLKSRTLNPKSNP